VRTILITAVLLTAIASCGGDPDEVSESPTASASPTDNICAANPDPATPDFNQVAKPEPGDSLSSPITVSGRIAAFEATFQITIFDAAGAEIADQTGMSSEGQALSDFSADVEFSVSEDTPACIWVYEHSARDGAPIHIVQVPVTLAP